jgi:hypothetical protein
MVVAARQCGKAGDQLGPIRGPHDRAVPPYPPQPQQSRRHVGGWVVVTVEPVQKVQDCVRVACDEAFVMRREQHGHPAVW